MKAPDPLGLNRLARATGHSWHGLRAAWRHEQAFRQEVAVVLILAPVGWWLGGNGLERGLLLAVLFLIPLVELLNSAIEAVVDRFGPEAHPLSGRAKDLGSAAVLASLLLALLVWTVVLLS